MSAGEGNRIGWRANGGVECGSYGFRLYSDDETRLYIDGQLLINNDGVHPPRNASGTVSLYPGAHSIRVDYFQGPRTQVSLQLFMTPPGGTEQIF